MSSDSLRATWWRRTRRWRLGLVGLAALTIGGLTIFERARLARELPCRPEAPWSRRLDRGRLVADVTTLSSPRFEGRAVGTAGNDRARHLVEDRFARIGLLPGREGFDQEFSFVHESLRGLLLPGRPHRTVYPSATNVVGTTGGALPAIVLSAHYDHLGVIDGELYPGADDNASGVACLLAAAEWLVANPPRHRVLVVAFDGEEEGLAGADAFVDDPPVPISEIGLAVNLDMISRHPERRLTVAGTWHTPDLAPLVRTAAAQSPVRVSLGHDRPLWLAGLVDDWTTASDHGPFHEAGIPFLYLGVEDHPDYHQPTDTADRIDPDLLAGACELALDLVLLADEWLAPGTESGAGS